MTMSCIFVVHVHIILILLHARAHVYHIITKRSSEINWGEHKRAPPLAVKVR